MDAVGKVDSLQGKRKPMEGCQPSGVWAGGGGMFLHPCISFRIAFVGGVITGGKKPDRPFVRCDAGRQRGIFQSSDAVFLHQAHGEGWCEDHGRFGGSVFCGIGGKKVVVEGQAWGLPGEPGVFYEEQGGKEGSVNQGIL